MAEVLDRPATLRLNPSDPVMIAMRDIAVGEPVGANVRASEPIVRGHKVAIQPIAAGEPVRKFGQIIGNATKAIQPGQHVHVHNLAFRPSAADHTIALPVYPELTRDQQDHVIASIRDFLTARG